MQLIHKVLACCFIFLLAVQTVSAQEKSIRVMTYNIRMNTPKDEINAWPNRKDHVAEMIGAKYKADLAGLQEVLILQLHDLESRLPDYAHIGAGREDGKEAGEFSPIFYRKSRFSVLDQGNFWLSATPEVPGSKSWNTANTRICTWGKFKDLTTGMEFYHFNTHTDHKSQEARNEGTKLIYQRIQSITGKNPVIVSGDFNSLLEDFPIQFLSGKIPSGDLKSDLLNTRLVSLKPATGPACSFNDWKKTGNAKSPIDYIFTRPDFVTNEYHVLEDQYDGYFPSDHLPVLVVLEVK